jgi:hypothetical protein
MFDVGCFGSIVGASFGRWIHGKSKGDLLRDPLRLPIFKSIPSLSDQNSNTQVVVYMSQAPFDADLIGAVFMRLELI